MIRERRHTRMGEGNQREETQQEGEGESKGLKAELSSQIQMVLL